MPGDGRKLEELEAAAAVVYEAMPPTGQQRWPLLDARCGTAVWVKHENQTPVGAFKVRGGLVYLRFLQQQTPPVAGIVAATRGNHGQSMAFAARRYGLPCAVVVPHGNSESKNRAMRALGAELIEEGRDFQDALDAARGIAASRGWHMAPSFDERLIRGVATWALELFRAAPDIATLYVPIGLGSGICGAIEARDALGLPVSIVGVVSAGAPAYARSLAQGVLVSHEVTTAIADGMACRTPVAGALERIRGGAARVIEVTDGEIEEAMRAIFDDTHTVAEGAGAAGLAALMKDRERAAGSAAFVLSGGNIDAAVFARVLRP